MVSKKREIKKVIFYTSIIRSFRTALIGHLYEIAQVYPVILLSEDLDDKLKKILGNKNLFPKLEAIVYVHQFSGPSKNIFKRNYDLYKLAKRIIFEHRPDIVITPGDTYPFEMYLLRYAKKIGALNISLQPSNIMEGNDYRKSVDLTNSYLRFPRFLPFFVRLFLTKCRKYAGHFLYYWVMPLLVGERPFWGRSSFVLRTGNFGMRDADYQIVFSKIDFDIHIQGGVPVNKLRILAHPLKRGINFFKDYLLPKEKDNYKEGKNIITLLLPPDWMGFRKKDFSLISEQERLKTRKEIISLTAEILKDWKIFVKPHPALKNFAEIKNIFESISGLVEVVNPKEPIDKYVAISDAIIGMPKANTTALSFASLAYPEKVVAALDFDKELLGDFYKDFEGVEYIENKDKFIQLLELIKNGKFKKQAEVKNTEIKKEEFVNFVDLVNSLFLEKLNKR